jgi:uncharacterized repeat protein (TIGR01451 family)
LKSFNHYTTKTTKLMKPITAVPIFFCLWLALSPVYSQSMYLFSATDIDGNSHDIPAYLDEGKPVLIFEFSSESAAIWSSHEAGASIDLYNSLGQGGSNEIVVLYIAGNGFDSEADIYNIDYSVELGSGYQSLDLTDNNPIPIIIAADNPEVNPYGKGNKMWICTLNQDVWLSQTPTSTETMLAALYDQCCTSLEGEDPALAWTSATQWQPVCDVNTLGYIIRNRASIQLDQVAVDVFLNGNFMETLLYDTPLPGCASVVLEYYNASIAEGDEVSMAIGQANANLSNDSISLVQDFITNTGTTLKIEVLGPTAPFIFYTMHASSNQSVAATYSNNLQNYLFLSPGCYHFTIGGDENSDNSETLLVGSVDENGLNTDTIYSGTINGGGMLEFTILAEGPAAVQKVWGYVFNDAFETSVFSPQLQRIAGIEVNHGPLTTFSNTDGYYEFPEVIPGETISIDYDTSVWPVYTTPSAGTIVNDIYIHNFGLNSSDPFWSLYGNFNTGLPYQCETGITQDLSIFNSGNQPTSGALVLVHDPLLTPVGYGTPPLSVNGNEITFAITELSFGGVTSFSVEYEDVSAALLGETLTAQYTLTTYDDQGAVVNVETSSQADTLFCAYDPNDKYGFPLGEGPEGFIANNTPLKYRIRFQNTGNFPATTVVIRDTLPETLQWESFAPISSSHPCSIALNAETREVVWTFPNIMLPDSASDPLGSIGNLWFDIEMAGLEVGDEIENTAYIYFDSNEAIVTNTSLHTIAQPLSAEGVSSNDFLLYPNPTRSTLFIKGAAAENVGIRITDLSGRVVLEKTLASNFIDVSMLSPGMYLVSLGTDRSTAAKLAIQD